MLGPLGATSEPSTRSRPAPVSPLITRSWNSVTVALSLLLHVRRASRSLAAGPSWPSQNRTWSRPARRPGRRCAWSWSRSAPRYSLLNRAGERRGLGGQPSVSVGQGVATAGGVHHVIGNRRVVGQIPCELIVAITSIGSSVALFLPSARLRGHGSVLLLRLVAAVGNAVFRPGRTAA